MDENGVLEFLGVGCLRPVVWLDETSGRLLRERATNCGYITISVDARRMLSKSALLAELAEAMRFPEWFGNNWDALLDCLRDVSTLVGSDAVLLFIENAGALEALPQEELATFIGVVGDIATSYLRVRGVRLRLCLVDGLGLLKSSIGVSEQYVL
ncbi:MAG: barstar family protein [Acidobacteria bacterium]|nr:barstar family protein [Acidobacteriota bacterium]